LAVLGDEPVPPARPQRPLAAVLEPGEEADVDLRRRLGDRERLAVQTRRRLEEIGRLDRDRFGRKLFILPRRARGGAEQKEKQSEQRIAITHGNAPRALYSTTTILRFAATVTRRMVRPSGSFNSTSTVACSPRPKCASAACPLAYPYPVVIS